MREVWQLTQAVLQGMAQVPAEIPHAVALALGLAALGAVGAVVWGYAKRRAKRRALWARQRDLATLRAMSWQEFEQLTGETFRRLGFAIRETGGGRADGGVDVLVTKQGRSFVIQCKHYKRQRIGAPVVREAVGVAVGLRAAGVYVIALSGFTRAALAYAKGKPVYLIDGAALLAMIRTGTGEVVVCCLSTGSESRR
jgi:restriction system protein